MYLTVTVTGLPVPDRSVALTVNVFGPIVNVLMLAPFAPHISEEIWERLGHKGSLARHAWPKFDAAKLQETTMELPVQVNGKLRDKISVAADADEQTILKKAESAEKVRPWLEGKTIVKRLYVPKKLVNFVVK